MTKLCIDFGSGYNPKTGYKTQVDYKDCEIFIEIMDMDNNCIDKVLVKKKEKILEPTI